MSVLPGLLALSLLTGAPSDPSPTDRGAAGNAPAPKAEAPTRPRTNVEPKREDGADAPNGRLMFGLQLGGMPRLQTGGSWTREKPFYVQAQLGPFFFFRIEHFHPPVTEGQAR